MKQGGIYKLQTSITFVEKDSYTINGYEVLEREVKKVGSSGRVYVPVSWAGAMVKVIRTGEPTASDDAADEEKME